MQIHKNNFLKYLMRASRIFFLAGLFSCDFTPRLHREILDAQELIRSQKYELAVLSYKDILKNNPPKEIKVKIYFQLGDLLSIYLGKNKEGAEYYSKIIEISDSPIWLVKTEERLGEINFNYLKNYKMAINSYKKLADIQPPLEKQNFYEYQLVLSYLNDNQLVEAERILNKIKKETTHDFWVKSLFQLGMIEFRRKNWQGAIDHWKEYLKYETSRVDVVQTKFLMANAYETIEHLKTAYTLYYSILGEYPNTEVLKKRLQAIYQRRVSRKR